MKDKIPYLTTQKVINELQTPGDEVRLQINNKLSLLPAYIRSIRQSARSSSFAKAVAMTEERIYQNQQANPDGVTAPTAGAYFANENVIAGSMTPVGVALSNVAGIKNVPNWEERAYKLKLGPGITFIEPASVYSQLQAEGSDNPELAVNYTAPFGTAKTRQGLADVINARAIEEETFSADEVIQASGATEALELGLEAISQLAPRSEVLSIGFSYYTAFFSADQKGLACRRVMPESFASGAPYFQPSADEILRSIGPDTSTLLLTIPNNPTGESYSDAELRKIMMLAKEENLLVLFDAIFEEMYFDRNTIASPVIAAAQEIGALEQLLIVDSLSKRSGYAGARLGWLATKNQSVLSTLENVILARRCNPPLVYEPVAQFEGAASQFSRQLQLYGGDAGSLAEQILDVRDNPWPIDRFLSMYEEWTQWRELSQEYYRQNFEIVQLMLSEFVDSSAMTEAAFNTFVKMGTDMSSVDFMTKLMLLMGTYTQVGPCFGISESVWKQELGLWARVSFATDREDLIEGLTRMIALAEAYREYQLGDSSQYPVVSINYDQQI